MVWYHHRKLQEFFVICCKTSDEKKKVNEKGKIFVSSDQNFGVQKTYF